MTVEPGPPPPGTYAVVTGAGGAVGPHLAAALAVRGWPVALVTRPGKEELAATSVESLADPDAPVEVVGIDLSDEMGARMAFSALDERLGACAVLMNAVGGFTVRRANEPGADDLHDMLSRNLFPVVNASKAVLPGMLARGTGFILGMSAGAASDPAPGRTAYAAAKGAVSAYFRSLAAELVGTGVHAAVLSPAGTIDTAANRAAMPSADFSKWIGIDAIVHSALHLAGNPAVRELVVRGG